MRESVDSLLKAPGMIWHSRTVTRGLTDRIESIIEPRLVFDPSNVGQSGWSMSLVPRCIITMSAVSVLKNEGFLQILS